MSIQAPPAPANSSAGAHVASPPPGPDGQAARLTLRAFVGSALAVLPLLQLLNDTSWLVQAWIAMAIVIVPAGVLRLWRRPSALQLVPGVILLIGYLTRVYLPDHAWFGVVPTRSSWSALQAMWTALGHTIHDSAAPLSSTAPIRLYLSIGLVLLAIVVDIVVVEIHRPALAGVPILLIFTLSGAIPREAVSWLWFALAGAGYLLILSSRSIDELTNWGRIVARPERGTRSRLTSSLSGRRIGVIAIIVAVLIPFIVPLGSVNLIANALHNGQVGSGGNGKGSTGVVIDPLAVLRGELTKGSPVNLFTVNVTGDGAKSAFYLRTAVLENYNGKAWVQSSDPTTSALTGSLTVAPSTLPSSTTTSQFSATVTVSKLGGTAPVFATPTQVGGTLPKTWTWSSRYGLVSGDVTSGLRYTETVAQPDPSTAALEASVAVRRNTAVGLGSAAITDNLSTDKIPDYVNQLVAKITAGMTTPYDKARALSTYFTDPANGFVYSLQTKSGESGNDLVDFLTTGKAGFCQQYAASLGVMLRSAGIPARVVLGYTHPAPDASGKFVVTSDDAHAWVEAYFTGIGWIPFDPTPLTGVDAARAVALPWAPHATAAAGGADDESKARADANAAALAAAAAGDGNSPTGSTASTGESDQTSLVWAGLALLAVAVLIASLLPGLIRVRRRRRRLHRARGTGPEPLWDELADTTRDLALGWSDARTTRQVTVWLGELLQSDRARLALATLGDAVERERYSASFAAIASSGWREGDGWRQGEHDLAAVRSDLLSSVGRWARWRARALPASLWKPASHDHRSTELIAPRSS